MSEIMTYTKKMFDPLQPNVELIDIEDIAHALSMGFVTSSLLEIA